MLRGTTLFVLLATTILGIACGGDDKIPGPTPATAPIAAQPPAPTAISSPSAMVIATPVQPATAPTPPSLAPTTTPVVAPVTPTAVPPITTVAPSEPAATPPQPGPTLTVSPVPLAPTATPDAVSVDLQQRLDRLTHQLEERRQQLHIPGMAIAVVKDDEVILARGFGLADIENETPVTPETIFAIGSATKAFTGAPVGMLVDDGKMDWDDPVTEHIPYFTLNIDSEDENAQVTIRDLLSHRTGFPRMGILIASGNVSREDVLRAATGAEPWVGLREKWYYSSVMYLAAGVAAANAASTDWDSLVTERILSHWA